MPILETSRYCNFLNIMLYGVVYVDYSLLTFTIKKGGMLSKLVMMNNFFPIRSIYADAVRNKPEQI